MLATAPDADRVGSAMICPDGSYELVSGNEVGVDIIDGVLYSGNPIHIFFCLRVFPL